MPKLATNTLLAVAGKVYSFKAETMVVPSVQLVKVYPTLGTAVTVTELLALKVPLPLLVPPNNGSEETAMLYCAVKLATSVLFPEVKGVIGIR